jgi:cell division protein FtsX
MALALTVVATLSTILAVPIQEATAEDEDYEKEVEVEVDIEQENEVEVEQENECEKTIASCVNLIEEISQNNQIGDNEEDNEE